MHVVPVLDLKAGRIVAGKGGRRDAYRPIESPLVGSSAPEAVARAMRDQLGVTDVYLADLDAIAGSAPAIFWYQVIQELGIRLWVDAGVRAPADAKAIVNAGVAQVVLGLETLDGPDAVTRTRDLVGCDRVIFSLDLLDGAPMGDRSAWDHRDPLALSRAVIERGIRHILVLDLARVGTNQGTGSEDLCRRLSAEFPEIELSAGGGIRNREDLHRLCTCGVTNVLVSSAIHRGDITRTEVDCYSARHS